MQEQNGDNIPMKHAFDAIIIGAGQAAALAGRLTMAGWSVALIEKEALGGTCVNRGCTPTKAMIASAKAAYLASRAADFGLTGGEAVRVNLALVKARKDGIVANFRARNEAAFAAMAGCTLIYGSAQFESPHSIRVGEDILSAPRIFLNVGARPRVPRMAGIADNVPYLTSTTILDLEVLPDHLIIVGGSYVGLEFAQMFRRFGSRVTVIEQGANLLGHEDTDVCRSVGEILGAEGIDLQLNAKCIRLERGPLGPMVHVGRGEG